MSLYVPPDRKQSVQAIVFRDDLQAVYMHRKLRDDVWEFPVGKVDAGETPLMAVQRELAEETGLDYGPDRFFYLGSVTKFPGWLCNTFAALAEESDRPRVTEPEKHADGQWFQAMPEPILPTAQGAVEAHMLSQGVAFYAFQRSLNYIKGLSAPWLDELVQEAHKWGCYDKPVYPVTQGKRGVLMD